MQLLLGNTDETGATRVLTGVRSWTIPSGRLAADDRDSSVEVAVAWANELLDREDLDGTLVADTPAPNNCATHCVMVQTEGMLGFSVADRLSERSELAGDSRHNLCWAGAEALGGSPLYLFPCSHAFHSRCLISDLSSKLASSQVEQLAALQARLTAAAKLPPPPAPTSTSASASASSRSDGGEGGGGVAAARAALDAMVGAECPLCGDLMIRSITQPFISEHEAAEEALSWAIPV